MNTELSVTSLSDAGQKAAESLGAWINRRVQLHWQEPRKIALEDAGAMLGNPESIVPVCILEVSGPLPGRLVLLVDAETIASFVNSLLGQPVEITPEQKLLINNDPMTFWDELSRSAALETANIVACAFLNALAAALPASVSGLLVPSPPRFALDYAGSLGQFLLADLAVFSDHLLVTQSRMLIDDNQQSDWRLVWIPIADHSQPESSESHSR